MVFSKSPTVQAMLALSASASAFPTVSTFSRRATQAATDLCGMPDDYLILSGTPWIVYNMMYNSQDVVGTSCTGYQSHGTNSDGNPAVTWNSTWNIEYVESTDNEPKGYSFVGLTEHLETQLSGIASIPSTYDWTRTNTTAYKGNVCYDFIVSDTKGDSTSTAARELMLWLQYDGGQLPIGWGSGAVASIDNLYGTSWKLYQGVNTGTGITVSSLLPDTQFSGTFSGDIRDWLQALVTQDLFTDSTYVNVGNAGTEPFYGDAVLEATLGLQINLGTPSSTVAAIVSTKASSVASTSAAAKTTATVSSSTIKAVVSSPSSSTAIIQATSAPVSSTVAAPTTVESVTTASSVVAAASTSAVSLSVTPSLKSSSVVAASALSSSTSHFHAAQATREYPHHRHTLSVTASSVVAAATSETGSNDCAIQYVYV